jgi:hypothetical protein
VEYAPGDVVRLTEDARVPDFARGRMCCVKAIVAANDEGAQAYGVQMMYTRFCVPAETVKGKVDNIVH